MASSTRNKKNKDKTKKAQKSGGKGALKKKDRRLNRKNADRLDLYQRSVNSPDNDVDFLTEQFEILRGRPLRHLREDFCGTAALAAEFLKRHPENTAEGFDLDPEPIEWGKQRNFSKLEGWPERMTFHLADVRNPADKRPDLTCAQNFSYWCFKTRAELLAYFQSVYADLAPDGAFVVDLYGGPEALHELEEERDIDDGAFTYVWDQQEYQPGTGNYKTAIHFRFRDGSEWENAFEYDWRFWNLCELRDLLFEAGFGEVRPYFEGTDEDDDEDGNGVFEYDEVGENCEAWLGYLISLKGPRSNEIGKR
ncbi:MAG: class I SAM-dependent methyltransferase [Planctomycetes bacterium]|nr:class I SAM-dependent methyltransferase [Planctomycetota bacterium]MCB9910997.1 class I SAM-dependent methyltransferase [Planctomycetota bacterium]HPF15344.1 class I SAM-dependent methyltransferase [Planctomycetota bacterium]HRV81377.1 class I SAM-dependent methyltransferase [Planctomycetota bacterium]